MSRKEKQTAARKVAVNKTPGSKIAAFFYPYKKHYSIFLLFLPVLIWYILFCYVPMHGILIAFEDFKIIKGVWGSEFVGLENFARLFRSPTFLRSLRNTIVISTIRIIVTFPMPIVLALMLNEVRNLGFKKIAQTISYLPHFLSWVVLAGIFTQLLSPSTGIVNMILNAFGIESIYFYGDNRWFIFTTVVTALWKEIGWGTVIYIAAITSIDTEQYEAADIDGASRWQKIFFITLPGIVPVITIQLILTSGNIINAGFDQIFNTYNEAVYETADIIDTYVYRKGMVDMEYSFSTAAGLFKNVVSFAMIIVTNMITKRLSDGENGIW